MLWGLLAAPVLVAAHIYFLRKRRKSALGVTDVALIRQAQGGRNRIRRHIPAGAAAGLALPVVGGHARPSAVVTLASQRRHHHHGDGCVGQHARRRCRAQPHHRRPGRRQSLRRSTRPADPHRHCGIFRRRLPGAAAHHRHRWRWIRRSKASGRNSPPPSAPPWSLRCRRFFRRSMVSADGARLWRRPIHQRRLARPDVPTRRPSPPCRRRSQPGSYSSAAIVLMTDGRNTTGPDPVEAARVAPIWGCAFSPSVSAPPTARC